MTPHQLAKFAEIRRLLAEGYRIHETLDDGIHKTADGLCEVSYPTAYSDDEGCGGVEAKGLMIYSYVLGPSREHYFHKGRGRGDYNTFYSQDPFETALAEVRRWVGERKKALTE